MLGSGRPDAEFFVAHSCHWSTMAAGVAHTGGKQGHRRGPRRDRDSGSTWIHFVGISVGLSSCLCAWCALYVRCVLLVCALCAFRVCLLLVTIGCLFFFVFSVVGQFACLVVCVLCLRRWMCHSNQCAGIMVRANECHQIVDRICGAAGIPPALVDIPALEAGLKRSFTVDRGLMKLGSSTCMHTECDERESWYSRSAAKHAGVTTWCASSFAKVWHFSMTASATVSGRQSTLMPSSIAFRQSLSIQHLNGPA